MPPAVRAALVGFASSAALAAADVHAQGQAWPVRAVRIVAAQQAGSATDHVARTIADALAEAWGQPVVVDNRPGAGGAIGTQAAARAAPDGYTLLVGGLSNMVVSPLLEPGFGLDPAREFVGIGRIAWVPFVAGVHADVPAATVKELVAYAKEHPGKVAFGTVGPTSYSRLCIDLMIRENGLDLVGVEYRGAPAAMLDLVAGRVQLYINEVAGMKQHADAGRIRLLAVAGDRRSSRVPGVPTLEEAGVTAVRMTPWYGLFAPAELPADIRERIEAAYLRAMKDPTLVERLEAQGYEPIVDAPGRFAEAWRRDIAAARDIATRIGKLPAK